MYCNSDQKEQAPVYAANIYGGDLLQWSNHIFLPEAIIAYAEIKVNIHFRINITCMFCCVFFTDTCVLNRILL